ncbi:MAG TPA: SH3 domain-containing protein [Pyrinomonadaceae bacterium]|nr:SH3 domain-containing protein [Pyrinomonadaceae bacterium]
MDRVFVFLMLVFAVSAANVFGQERFVRPVDEAAKDASFLAFRTKLIAAAERKDARFIYTVLDRDIKNGFGGNDGIAEFKKMWKPESKESGFWDEFLPVIKNGGSFAAATEASGRMFIAPFSFSKWPEDLDSFDYHLIFGNNVNLRAAPSMTGEVLGRLSYNVVKLIESQGPTRRDERPTWYKVETLGGKTGWVNTEFIRSPISYRAGFEKKRGVWKMTYFVAGD